MKFSQIRSRLLVAFTVVAVLASAMLSCGKPAPDVKPDQEDTTRVSPTDSTDINPTDTTQNIPAEPVGPPDWVNGYPVGVTVEQFTEEFSGGKKCVGWIATIDFAANPYLRFNCTATSGKKKTPSQVFSDWPRRKGTAVICTNAGYFAGTTSMSLVYTGGDCEKIAPIGINWPSDEAYQCTVYPVRSAIGQMEDGHFEIKWVACTDKFSRTHYAYPSALDNNEKTQTFMTEAPSPDYPGAVEWKPIEAVGGGPRLVRRGKNVAEHSYWAECLDSGGTSALYRVNRTGAGITDDGKLILIVCDGRGSNDSVGYTCPELADKFISLGCVDAFNLDGGGSSCMVGPEGVLNKPSDASGERPVVSCILISELPTL